MEASLAEARGVGGCGEGDIICPFTSFPSHIILTLQLCGAFCRIRSAMLFPFLDLDFLLIQNVSAQILNAYIVLN